jgi:beta-barrel assembly-enhancing protease
MIKLFVALLAALMSLLGFCSTREENPATGETQYVALSPEQEIALGLESAPQLAREYGGLSPDAAAQARVDAVGAAIVRGTVAASTPYPFDFHVLDDDATLNAFALPGGQVFVTRGLLRRMDTEGELAGVLAHEIAHVVARHGAEHLAKQQLTEGLAGAATIAAWDPSDPTGGQGGAVVAAAIGQLVNMRYGRDDELESDRLGVRFLGESGYDPRAMLGVLEALAEEGGAGPPEFFSTHPSPANRVARLREAIAEEFPGGVPAGLRP